MACRQKELILFQLPSKIYGQEFVIESLFLDLRIIEPYFKQTSLYPRIMFFINT